MAKADPGKIRQKATKYLAKGNWAKALETYEELEKVAKNDLRVPQKIAELHRRLGETDKAIAKYRESAQKYREKGFLIQAIAVYKVILEIAPDDVPAKEALSELVEQRSAPSIKKRAPEPEERAPLPKLKERPPVKPDKEEEEELPFAPDMDEDEGLAMPAEDEEEIETDVEIEDEGPEEAEMELGEEAEEGVSLEADEDEDLGLPGDDNYGNVEVDLGEQGSDGEITDMGPELDGSEALAGEPGSNQEIALDQLEVVPIECEESLPESGPERTPLFSDLEPGEFTRVFELLESRVVESGAVLIREGEEGDSIFILARGEVRVTRMDENGEEHDLAVLGPSAFFGEIGYFHGKRRATVTALKKSLVLEMSKSNLDQVVKEFPRVKAVLSEFYRERVLDNLMALTALFSHLSPEERRQIGASFARKQFDPGQIIVKEGDPGDSMFLIKSGEVVVKTTDPETGDDIELARLVGGEFFGEVSLVKNKPRTATIQALEDTELLELSRNDFKDIASEHPEIGAALEKTIEQRVEDTIKKMLDRIEKT